MSGKVLVRQCVSLTLRPSKGGRNAFFSILLAPVGKIRKRAPGSPTKGQRRADSAELGWPAERALLGPLSRPGTLSLRTNDGVEQEHP